MGDNLSREMDANTWDSLVASLPGSHILQTWEWGQAKSQFGWQPLPTAWRDKSGRDSAAAMVLARRLPVGGFAARMKVMYVPKGPLLCDWQDESLRRQVFRDLRALARRQGAIFVKIDPDLRLGTGIPGEAGAIRNPVGETVVTELQAGGWRFSSEQVQFRNTVLIDLRPPEEELLANMKQKTRYNIRLAGRKGVVVRPGGEADLDLLFDMYAETSIRDGFVIRSKSYYQTVWGIFMRRGYAEPLIAEVDGEPVAALLVFRFGGKAWYLYGMSKSQHREKMPNYLLQWVAMRRAKQAGCITYDFWGAPDVFSEDDPMWGVYRFKEGFGGEVVRYLGAWDLPVRPVLYRLYMQVLPKVLDWMRARGFKQTRESLGGRI
jgi:lipid II:glycine glycyltransferase (peptidoglycan interpeptide bridge formation enzyme)